MQIMSCLGVSLKVVFQTRVVSCQIFPIRVPVGCCHRAPGVASGIVHLLHVDGCVAARICITLRPVAAESS